MRVAKPTLCKGTADQTVAVGAGKNPGTRPTRRLERQPEQASAGSKVRPGPRAPGPTSNPPAPRGCSGQNHYGHSPWHLRVLRAVTSRTPATLGRTWHLRDRKA